MPAYTIIVPDSDVLSRLCGTNDCNLMSVLLFCLFRLYAVLSCPVSHKTLQLSDRYRLALDTTDTFTLTLALLGTYATADSRKRRRFADDLISFLKLTLFHFLNKCGDIDRYGTSLHT